MNLGKIALASAVIGLIALIFLSNTLEPRLIKIADINGKMIDQTVKVSGEITKIKIYDSFTLLMLDDKTENMTIISYQNLLLKNSDKIEVIGKIVEYKGSLEVEADKISLISP